MPLLALGISHHTAPLELREKLAITPDLYADKVNELCADLGVREVILLSTCNRTELYGMVADGQQEQVTNWLLAPGGLAAHDAGNVFYRHERSAAVQHLFKVACGLDSMVLGEPQILGQLKDAWRCAHDAGAVGKYTDRLFQRAFAVAKDVRTNTGINDHPVSVAYITAVLARQIFGDLSSKTVMLVGAGEMMTLCGQHFRQQSVGKLLIANRSLDRAQALGEEVGATAIPLETLPERLHEADILITSTAATVPVITHATVKAAIKRRRRSPMFMVDLGVPRDIEPRVNKIGDVYLYTIDDLRQVADEGLSKRQEAARKATAIIDSEVGEYQRWLHGARAGESLKQLRRSAMSSGQELAEKALRQIRSGGDPEAAIKQLSHGLTQRILHGPSTRLREAAEQQQEDILRAADWLFRGTTRSPAPGEHSRAGETPTELDVASSKEPRPDDGASGEEPRPDEVSAPSVLHRSAGKQGS